MTKTMKRAMDAFDAATRAPMARYEAAIVGATEDGKRLAWGAYVAETAEAQRAYEAAVRADRAVRS